MDVLNVLAQFVVITGVFIWMTLKGIWNLGRYIWQIIRDFTPIISKRIWKVTKQGARFLRKWSTILVQFIYRHCGTGIHNVADFVHHFMLNSGNTSQLGKTMVAYFLAQLGVTTINVISQIKVVKRLILVNLLKGAALSLFVVKSLILQARIGASIILALISRVTTSQRGTDRSFSPVKPSIASPTGVPTVNNLPNIHTVPGMPNRITVVEQFSLKKRPTKKSKFLSKLSLTGMIVSFFALFVIFFPDFVLAIIPYQTAPIESAVDQSALGGKFSDGNLYAPLDLPERNEYLPDGNWLVIPKIGVLTQIQEAPTEDHEKALEKGVWRVPEFANPTQGRDYPTILVAHKFGYISWSNKFRRQNSFYNLEKLEIGDTFDIIWDKRKFTYEIYAGEEGKEITDYKADVVLYTCKYLNSPARIFRYARRVEY